MQAGRRTDIKSHKRGDMSKQIEQARQSRLKELIAKGKEQGYITYAEVNDHLPATVSAADQIEDIIRMINDMGITVYETAPDPDDLLSSEENTADEIAAEEAAAALAAVETEAVIEHGPLKIDFAGHRVWVAGSEVVGTTVDMNGRPYTVIGVTALTSSLPGLTSTRPRPWSIIWRLVVATRVGSKRARHAPGS